MIPVVPKDNNVEKALKSMKRASQKDGTLRRLRERRHYKSPSEKRKEAQSRSKARIAKRNRRNTNRHSRY